MPAYYRCACGGQAVPPLRHCPDCLWIAGTAEEPDYLRAKLWSGIVNTAGRTADARARLERALERP